MSYSKLTEAPLPTKGKIMLWTVGTPNGFKASITLEELKAIYGLEYDFKGLSFKDAEQKEDWFLKIGYNGRIPALSDHSLPTGGPHHVFESASIQYWLADRYDVDRKISFSEDQIRERSECLSWVMWGQGGLGPMQGQANHFFRYAPEKIPYGIKRYQDETKRLYSVIEDRLSGRWEEGVKREWIVGGKYSIADINLFGWARSHAWAGVEDLSDFPNLAAWIDRVAARPAVQAGLDIPTKQEPKMSKEEEEKKAEEARKWIFKKEEEK